MKRTIKQIEKEIEDLKKQLPEIKGTACSIYTRICGYYRPLNAWNEGRRSEYKTRKPFVIGAGK